MARIGVKVLAGVKALVGVKDAANHAQAAGQGAVLLRPNLLRVQRHCTAPVGEVVNECHK